MIWRYCITPMKINLLMVGFERESADVAEKNLDAALEKYKLGSLSGIEFREFQRSYLDAVVECC